MKYRSFKVSINFFYIRIYSDTKVYAIKNKATHFFLAFWYSLISILLGWWGGILSKPFSSIRNTLKAIHINLNGGLDHTKIIQEEEYEEIVNYVWNNLLRETLSKIKKNDLELIIDIQREFEKINIQKYEKENNEFILTNLPKVGINKVNTNDIEDFFDALKSYRKSNIE